MIGMKIKGRVTLRGKDGCVVSSHNTIVNLSAFISLLTGFTVPNTSNNAYVVVNGSVTAYASSITVSQVSDTEYEFTFTFTLGQTVYATFLVLYPQSLQRFQSPLAEFVAPYPLEVSSITWTITISDPSGLLFNILLPNAVQGQPIQSYLYMDSAVGNGISPAFTTKRAVYGVFTAPSSITACTVHFITAYPITSQPTAVPGALQLVPASSSQFAAIYYLYTGNTVLFQFTFTSATSPPADGFAVTLFAGTPPYVYNTASVSGMVNPQCLVGGGEQVVVEFDPYASSPISVTYWKNGSYVSTLVSASGAGSGTSLTAGHVYVMSISYDPSSNALTVSVIDTDTNTTVASASTTLPFTPPSTYFVYIAARNGGDYANWSLTRLSDWYPYNVPFSIPSTIQQEQTGQQVLFVTTLQVTGDTG